MGAEKLLARLNIVLWGIVFVLFFLAASFDAYHRKISWLVVFIWSGFIGLIPWLFFRRACSKRSTEGFETTQRDGLFWGLSRCETIGDLFDNFFGRRFWPLSRRASPPFERSEGSTPAIDVNEDNDKIGAKVEPPGMMKEDIAVNVTDDVPTIMENKNKEEEMREEDYLIRAILSVL